jgi:NADPH:quinone reductase-like Zn-dependent oxidoreductase
VLINGASGSTGTSAVQLARHFGAEVTAVCSARNADLVRSLGAKHVVDYNSEDFSQHRIGTTSSSTRSARVRSRDPAERSRRMVAT